MTTRTITVTHQIEVDTCIAEEVHRLNNEHRVTTVNSCCGHGDPRMAYITVRPEDMERMFLLEYERLPTIFIMQHTFRPKSECTCGVERQCDSCGKMVGGDARAEPFVCRECREMGDVRDG